MSELRLLMAPCEPGVSSRLKSLVRCWIDPEGTTMSKKHTITFHEVTAAVTGFVTKFGGQPDWFSEPQWPLSRQTGKPMRFICQIKLEKGTFPSGDARM